MPTLQGTDCRTISAGRIAWRTVLPCRNRRWNVRRIPLWALPVLYVFACVSIVIAFIDLDHHLILNVVLLPTLIATVLLLAVASFGIGSGLVLVAERSAR